MTSFFTCKHSSESRASEDQTPRLDLTRESAPPPPHSATVVLVGHSDRATLNKQLPEPSRELEKAPHGPLVMDTPQDKKSSDPLVLPAPEVLAEIARKQEARAAEIQAARVARRQSKDGEEQDRTKAAVLIQRNYRGHRTRRAMQGRGLDPSVRWIEALKEGASYGTDTVYVNMTDM